MHPGHHTRWYKQLRIQNSTYCIAVLWCTPWEDFTIHGYSYNIPPSLLLWHDCCGQTEEGKLHFARKCLSKKWGIEHGKINQALQLAFIFKMQKLTRKCHLLTDSPSPQTCTHRHENDNFIVLSIYVFGIMISSWTYWRHAVYSGVINYAQCVMVGSSSRRLLKADQQA